jgi:hypothetical protein
MSRFLQKLTELSRYHLLSSLIGMTSGTLAIATVVKYLMIGSEEGGIGIYRKPTWAELMSLSIVLGVGGLLVVIGSVLVLKRKNKLGAILILIPGILYSFLIRPPYAIALFVDYQCYGVGVGGYILGLLLSYALPIASSILAMQKVPSKKEPITFQAPVDSKRQLYAKASVVLGLISGIGALVPGIIVAFDPNRFWPLSGLALFLIPDGALIILGSYFILKRRTVLGAMLVLIPGIIYGFFGLTMLSFVVGGSFVSYFFIPSYVVGLALPIASCILAVYSR